MTPLGVLMLDGKMSTAAGMMGSDATWGYPVKRLVVAGSHTPLSAGEAVEMAPLYVRAAREIERDGVRLITANCGLMALAQPEVAAAVNVPVVLSSLVAVPTVARMLAPHQRVGILTFFEDAVGEENFNASGWSSNDYPVRVAGVGDSGAWLEFLATKELDDDLRARLITDLRSVVEALLERSPDIGALVAECTMLPAVLDSLRPELPVPVFDLLTILDWALAAATGRRVREVV
jgi:Asp/Glu/Hydantoin racemase